MAVYYPSSVVSAGIWTNGSNAYGDNGSYATCANTSRNTDYPIELGGFGISIPSTATLDSVTLTSNAWRSASNAVTEKMALYDSTTIIGTQGSQSLTATADGTTWSFTRSPTVAQLNSANLKIQYVSRRTATSAVSTYLDYVSLTVLWSHTASPASIATTSSVPAPTLSTSVNLTPAVVAATAAVYLPGPIGNPNATVAPAVVPATSSVPAATVSGSASVTAGVVNATTALAWGGAASA